MPFFYLCWHGFLKSNVPLYCRHHASSQNTDKSDQKTHSRSNPRGFKVLSFTSVSWQSRLLRDLCSWLLTVSIFHFSDCPNLYCMGSDHKLHKSSWILFSDNHLTVMCRPIWKMKYFLALHSRSFFPKSAFYSVTCAWLVIQTQFQHDRSDVSFTACIAYQKIERYFAEIMLNIVLNIYIILHHLESSRFTFTVLALSWSRPAFWDLHVFVV